MFAMIQHHSLLDIIVKFEDIVRLVDGQVPTSKSERREDIRVATSINQELKKLAGSKTVAERIKSIAEQLQPVAGHIVESAIVTMPIDGVDVSLSLRVSDPSVVDFGSGNVFLGDDLDTPDLLRQIIMELQAIRQCFHSGSISDAESVAPHRSGRPPSMPPKAPQIEP